MVCVHPDNCPLLGDYESETVLREEAAPVEVEELEFQRCSLDQPLSPHSGTGHPQVSEEAECV